MSEKPTSSKRFARRNEARAVADKLMRPPGLKRVDRKRRDYSLRDLQRPFANLNRRPTYRCPAGIRLSLESIDLRPEPTNPRRELTKPRRELTNPRGELTKPRREMTNLCREL